MSQRLRNARLAAVPLVKLAVFAAVTVVATALLAATIANTGTGFDVSYKARFTDATNLNEGDDVRVAGVRVGQVEAVRVVDRRVAEVEFSFDPKQALTTSTTARIKYRNIVGQRYLALEQQPGAVGETLRPGDTIPLERTQPALDLTALFNGFKPLLRALDPDDLNKLSYELIQVLQGEAGTINSLLSHTASLANTIADKDQVIGELITNLNAVLDTINSRDDQASQLVVTLQQLVSGLAADREAIGSSIESVGVLAEVTAGLLEQGRPALRSDIEQLGLLAANLNDNGELVEHSIQFLPEKLTTIARTATYGSWFNFYLCDFGASVVNGSDVGVILPGDITIETPPYQSADSRCQR